MTDVQANGDGAAVESIESMRERLERARLSQEIRIAESTALLLQSFVDPRDELWDPTTGERWYPVGTNHVGHRREPDRFTRTRMLDVARHLEMENGFAINILNNIVSYTVGSGMQFLAVKRDDDVSDETVARVQAEIEAFCDQVPMEPDGTPMYERDDEEHFADSQREFVRRSNRDGDGFMRLFTDMDRGTVSLRFVDPETVKTPDEYAGNPDHQDGVITAPGDAQRVIGYWVNGQRVDASEMIHHKVAVDSSIRRGVSILWAIRNNLPRADKLLRNMSVMAGVRAAVAMVTQYEGATRNQVAGFADERADAVRASPLTGRTERFDRYGPGSHIRVPKGQKAEFPSMNTDASELVEVLQAELRSIAARVNMPEYMVSADASNSNYASTLIAESPTVKMFESEQAAYGRKFVRIIRRHLAMAVAADRLTLDEVRAVSITAVGPSLVVRDQLKETQRHETMWRNKVISTATWQRREGLDPEAERLLIEQEDAIPDVPPIPRGGNPNDPNQPDSGGGDDDGGGDG